jgi:amidophosphoribosyltransferase
LRGRAGIGHCRYPTAGCEDSEEAQPFYVNSPYGIALAHNGNLINTESLRREMFARDRRHINTGSDSEILLNVLAHELQRRDGHSFSTNDVFDAVTAVHARAQGGYACVALILGHGLLAFRDPHGIRPLVLGERDTAAGKEYACASESVAFDLLGFKLIRDVAPGEAVFIGFDGELSTRRCAEGAVHAPCIFEYVYLARPDSMIEDVSVYKARLRMGEKLAAKILRERPRHGIDAVIPIPDTARTAGSTLAAALGVPFREGLVKNRYIGRTFIMPGQGERVRSVRRKLNAIPLEFRKKNVLLVDDSIVRGTTSRQIVQMAREAGARQVYFASAAPPVCHPNVYGIDMPAASELVAHGRSVEQVREFIGADWLIYQDLPDLIGAITEGNEDLHAFDDSCFSGHYVTGVEAAYLKRIESARSDQAKAERRSA